MKLCEVVKLPLLTKRLCALNFLTQAEVIHDRYKLARDLRSMVFAITPCNVVAKFTPTTPESTLRKLQTCIDL